MWVVPPSPSQEDEGFRMGRVTPQCGSQLLRCVLMTGYILRVAFVACVALLLDLLPGHAPRGCESERKVVYPCCIHLLHHIFLLDCIICRPHCLQQLLRTAACMHDNRSSAAASSHLQNPPQRLFREQEGWYEGWYGL